MIYVNKIELWDQAFQHQDKLVREFDPKWIPVTDEKRPKKDQWVQLLQNRRLSGHAHVMGQVMANIAHKEYQPLEVFVAKYFGDDEGYPRWYLGYVGSSPIWMDDLSDCISHWQPLATTPNIPEMPEE